MVRRALPRCPALVGWLGVVVPLAAGAAAAAVPEAPDTRPAEPAGAFSAIRIDPTHRWQVSWRLTHCAERHSLLPGWPELRRDTLALTLELGRRLAWEHRGVTWRAGAWVRASAVRSCDEESGGPTAACEPAWRTSLGLSRFGLSAMRKDAASGRAVEAAAEWLVEGEPGERSGLAQVLAVTLSRVLDPAIVAASVALGASSGPRSSPVLSAAGEWRFVVTEGLAIYAGASLGVSVPLAEVSARVWTGVTLGGPPGTEVAVALERSLDRAAEYGWLVDLLFPESGG